MGPGGHGPIVVGLDTSGSRSARPGAAKPVGFVALVSAW